MAVPHAQLETELQLFLQKNRKFYLVNFRLYQKYTRCRSWFWYAV